MHVSEVLELFHAQHPFGLRFDLRFRDKHTRNVVINIRIEKVQFGRAHLFRVAEFQSQVGLVIHLGLEVGIA